MNWLEQEVERNQRRVDKIAQNPDATKLRSNRILYELERDLRKAQLEAWRNGEASLAAGITFIEPLFKSLGLQPLDYHGAADKLMTGDEYLEAAASEGFPEKSCDRTVALLGMCARGDLPAPGFVVATNCGCDPLLFSGTAMAYRFNVPFYTLDIPMEENETTLRYVADQLRELIGMVKAIIPGARYDEERHRYLQGMNRLAIGYLRDIYQIRKQRPCPVPTQDVFRLPRLPAGFPDPEYALEYFRSYRDELRELGSRGCLPEEKLRVMWTCTAPYFANPFAVLEKKGARIVVFQIDIVARLLAGRRPTYGEEQYGRKLSTLEEEARMLFSSSWVGPGQKWVNDILYICQDLEVEAIVNFVQVGCMATVGLGKTIAERAERELGIPTLNIEGRQLLTRDYNRADFESRLEQFVDICMERKAARPA